MLPLFTGLDILGLAPDSFVHGIAEEILFFVYALNFLWHLCFDLKIALEPLASRVFFPCGTPLHWIDIIVLSRSL
jgi:hypothetical protein